MRKYIICLITLIGLTLTGCGEKETGATMIWEKDGFKVTVSTTEDAIVVPENCNMRSVDGFVVKVVDGEKRYFGADGFVYNGIWKIKGKVYYFN